MKITITGSTGFIGRTLTMAMRQKGWEVISLRRSDFDPGAVQLAEKISGVDVVINLAGEPIVHRWTRKYMQELRDSRIITTRILVDAMSLAAVKPKLFISTSAIGIYDALGRHTESNHEYADDFIGKLCLDWEAEARPANHDTRVVIFRLGIVLASDGGALPKMLLPFKLGLGGKIGNGRQGFSWIHIQDLIAAYLFVIMHHEASGTFNLTSPQPCDNLSFTKTISRILHRPAFFTVPALALKLLYGKGASAVLAGQTALPERLLNVGFSYKFPTLEGALEDILKKQISA